MNQALLFISLILGSLFWSSLTAAPRRGWTAFGGGDDHGGYRNETYGFVSRFRLKWNVTAPAGTSFTSPVIHNDHVISLLSWLDILYVINERTGNVTNTCELPEANNFDYSGPTIGGDGSVLLQVSTDKASTYVISMDPFTCDVKWVSPSRTSLGSYPYGVVTSTVFGTVYAPSGLSCNEIFAVNAPDGQPIFNTTLFASRSAPDSWAPTVTYPEERVLFSAGLGNGNPAMIGEINAINGDLIWTRPLPAANSLGKATAWVPVLSRGIALAAMTKNVSSVALAAVAADHEEHLILWESEMCDWRYNSDATPAGDGRFAYLTCMDGVRSFDLRSGLPYIHFGPCNSCSGQPFLTDDFLFVKSNSGVLAFDKETGELVAQTNEGSDYFAFNNRTLFTSRMFAASLKAYYIE